MVMFKRFLYLLLLSLILFGGMGTSFADVIDKRSYVKDNIMPTGADNPQQADNIQTAQQGYAIGPGDTLVVTVFGEEDLSGEYVVDGSGYITFPLIGAVQVADSTVLQLKELLENLYSSGFLVNPQISIELADMRPFYIMGEVKEPGAYPYQEGLFVLNAVALAKGYTYRANTNIILIKRLKNGKIKEIRATEVTPVLPGDVVTIKERWF